MSEAVSKSTVKFVESTGVEKELTDFKAKFCETIYLACVNCKVNKEDWEQVVNDVCNMFCVTHEAKFDPEFEKDGKRANEYGLVYTCAHNLAIDMVNAEHRTKITYVDGTLIESGFGACESKCAPEINEESIGGSIDQVHRCEYGFTKEDLSLIHKQALIRLFLKSGNKRHVEMFTRRFFCGERVDKLASEYGEREDNVSLVCSTRLFPIYKAIVKRVVREDEDGSLELLDERLLGFLPNACLRKL